MGKTRIAAIAVLVLTAVQAANPKALACFVALLPQFVDPKAPVGFQLLILGASSLVVELFVLTLYAALAVAVAPAPRTRGRLCA